MFWPKYKGRDFVLKLGLLKYLIKQNVFELLCPSAYYYFYLEMNHALMLYFDFSLKWLQHLVFVYILIHVQKS